MRKHRTSQHRCHSCRRPLTLRVMDSARPIVFCRHCYAPYVRKAVATARS